MIVNNDLSRNCALTMYRNVIDYKNEQIKYHNDSFANKVIETYFLIVRHPCIDPDLGIYYADSFFDGEVSFNACPERKNRNAKVGHLKKAAKDMFLSGSDLNLIKEFLIKSQVFPAVVIVGNDDDLKTVIESDPLITKMDEDEQIFCGNRMLLDFDHSYDLVVWERDKKNDYLLSVPIYT